MRTAFVFLLSQLSFVSIDDSISVKREIKKLKASEYQITVTISKGGLGGFAGYYENFAEGDAFTATATASDDATFVQTESGVKFLWQDIGGTETITLSYTVTGIELQKFYPGIFKYILNDSPTSISLTEKDVSWK